MSALSSPFLNFFGLSFLFSSTLLRSLRREWSSWFFFDLRFDDHGSLVIFRSASVRPKHLFDPCCDHD